MPCNLLLRPATLLHSVTKRDVWRFFNMLTRCAGSSSQLDRFLEDPRRRTCAFVNPSPETMHDLEEIALQKSLELKETEECNVGVVVRLTWPTKGALPSPSSPTHVLSKLGWPTKEALPSPSPPLGLAWQHHPPATLLGSARQHHPPATLPPPPPESPQPPRRATGMRHVASFATAEVMTQVNEAVCSARARPELTEGGTGGVYLIRRPSREGVETVGVFKPSDEEAGRENNPRGLRGEEHAMREGFRLGSGAVRERVAYKLDRGYAGVPCTAVDKLRMRSRSGTRLCEQSGSIQRYVESEGDASEYRFDGSQFDEDACMRVALLDCWLFNCDRHEGNILVRPLREIDDEIDGEIDSEINGLYRIRLEPRAVPKRLIVPIDHAFILPNFGYYREAELAWRYWTAALRPFGEDAVKYVANIDIEAVCEPRLHLSHAPHAPAPPRTQPPTLPYPHPGHRMSRLRGVLAWESQLALRCVYAQCSSKPLSEIRTQLRNQPRSQPRWVERVRLRRRRQQMWHLLGRIELG